MTGDPEDMQARVRLTLPDRWFADDPPVLTGLVAGLGSVWAALYGLLGAVRLQARLGTATGAFLDLAARDFFAGRVARRREEADDAFRARLQRAMREERATRGAVIAAGEDNGFAVTVFEPARPQDTGAYNVAGGLAWGVAGGWGSLQMPLECLVTAQRGAGSDDETLRHAIVAVLPAGGAAWLRIVD